MSENATKTEKRMGWSASVCSRFIHIEENEKRVTMRWKRERDRENVQRRLGERRRKERREEKGREEEEEEERRREREGEEKESFVVQIDFALMWVLPYKSKPKTKFETRRIEQNRTE